MENNGEPCDYCTNYNELCDALNTIELLEETVQATWDGVREMLEEIADAFGVPKISSSGELSNGELVKAIIDRKVPVSRQSPTAAESADALYFALHEIIGEGRRYWPREIRLDGSSHLLDEALDIYERHKKDDVRG
jgi:hypothetical protein